MNLSIALLGALLLLAGYATFVTFDAEAPHSMRVGAIAVQDLRAAAAGAQVLPAVSAHAAE